MPSRDDQGLALIWTLCLLTMASLVGSALLLLSQTETYASLNYRLMSQARYGAESGIHQAVNYLMNTTTSAYYPVPYTVPSLADLSSYTLTASPVAYSGQPVVLSARSSVTANYPVSAVKTAFATAAQGTLAAGATTVNYAASAKLIAMRSVAVYGTTTNSVVQTWEITAEGTIAGPRPATVEVTATLERLVSSVTLFGLFATDPNCNAIAFSGGAEVDSYDSTQMTLSGGVPVTQAWGGDIGTNGNFTQSGSTTIIKGSLFSPRMGVGNCKSGAVNALTQNGGATVTNGVTQLSQNLSFATPAQPSPAPPTTNTGITKTATCSSLGLSSPTCTGVTADTGLTIDPAGGTFSAGNFNVSGGAKIILKSGTYNLNSIKLTGNSTLSLDTNAVVTMNVMGTGQTNPVDFSGGVVTNGSFTPRNFQVLYWGTGGVQVSGNTSTSLMVYAPNAPSNLSGGSHFYGHIVAKTINNSGGTKIHYDRHTDNEFGTIGNYALSSFSWKKDREPLTRA